jgi:hypothetical protein
MVEVPPDADVLQAVDRHHGALLSLHARANPNLPDPGLVPSLPRIGTGPALRTLTDAPVEQIPVSARLGVLGDLAKAGFPDWETEEEAYRLLAGSVADRRDGVDAEQLLDDLKLATGDRVPFHTLPSGRSLPHHESAFVGEDVCEVRTVRTGGLEATWLFSEFETDAPFAQVADWVDPRNWPRRGPLLFKAMELVGAQQAVTLGPPGDVHWHAVFREEVQLVQRVNTLLHCDFWQDGDRAAGMTYDLSLSVDNEIDVDRGFLLVNDLGPVRRVKALKIVGFTQGIWDDVAAMVCPFWTDWVRAAVQGGTSSTPTPRPTPSAPGSGTGDPDRSPWAAAGEAWIDFMGDSARTYLDIVDDLTRRAASPGNRAADLAADQRRLFSQLAKDWAQAWTHGLDTMSEIAREGLDAGLTPPGAPREPARGAATTMGVAGMTVGAQPAAAGTEATVLPVQDLTPEDSPAVGDLVSIEAGGARIPADAVTATVEPLPQGGHGVRLQVPSAGLAAGLYVGQVVPRPGADPVPVQLYVSQSAEV